MSLRSSAARVGLALAACLVLLVGAASLFGPALTPTREQIDAARVQLGRETGLRIEFHTAPTFRLLPRPELTVGDVVLSTDGGAVELQVPQARATFSTPALLRGRLVIQAVYLDSLAGVIDGDRVGREPATQGIVPAATAPAATMLPAKLTITGGLVQVRSPHPAFTGFFGDLHFVLDGLRSGAASLSGGGTWHGERLDVSGRLDSLAGFISDEPAAGSLRLTSKVLSGALAGTWPAGWNGGFRGSVSVSSPSLSGFLRMAGLSSGILAGVERFGFNGNSEPAPAGVAFADARVTLNVDTFEGTLGIEGDAGRRNLVGTLAADDFDLQPFAAALSAMTAGDAGQEGPFALFGTSLSDADMRLSVARAKLHGFHIEDVALSLLSRGDRFELSLADARAYGGSVKARLFVNDAGGGFGLKGDAAWSQIDVASLATSAGLDAAAWSGTTSGSFIADAAGRTIGPLLANIGGKGQASWQQGSVPAASALGALLTSEALSDIGAAPTPARFDLASAEFSATDGILKLEQGEVTGPETHVSLQGRCNITDASYSLVAFERGAGTEADRPASRGVEGVGGSHPHRFLPSAAHGWPARFDGSAGGLIP